MTGRGCRGMGAARSGLLRRHNIGLATKIPSGMMLSIGLGPGFKQSIRMSIVPDPCGESDRPNNSTEIERGKDDHTFRLDAAPNQVCSRLFDKIDWEAVGGGRTGSRK